MRRRLDAVQPSSASFSSQARLARDEGSASHLGGLGEGSKVKQEGLVCPLAQPRGHLQKAEWPCQ